MSEMRILTVRPPWSWAIIHGGKDVENRVRNIAGDYRGPVAIHAGLSYDEAWSSAPLAEALSVQYGATKLAVDGWPWRDRGVIIGVVDLVDVHWSGMECSRGAVSCHEYELCSPWAGAYQHHLVLANPRPLPEPIPFKGALGLRRLPDDVADEVREGIAS